MKNSRLYRKSTTSSVSRLASFQHAWRGLKILLCGQVNARIHLVATALTICLGWWLDISIAEWCWIAIVVGLVFCAEALNTGIELVVDLASPEWHALARDAKDVAAAGVLLATVSAVVVGLLVFVPKLAG